MVSALEQSLNKLEVPMTENAAKKLLHTWLQSHKTCVVDWHSQQLWEYNKNPLWAFVVRLLSAESSLNGVYGFHIYNDGRVLCVGRMDGYDS